VLLSPPSTAFRVAAAAAAPWQNQHSHKRPIMASSSAAAAASAAGAGGAAAADGSSTAGPPARPQLWDRICGVYEAAQQSGAAFKTETQSELFRDGGIEFVLRVASSLRAKPKG
jgi:hypothetical protein